MPDWDTETAGADGWEDGPASAGASKWDEGPNGTSGPATDSFSGGNNADRFDAPGGDNACRNCGQEGHFVRDCPEPKKMTGECFRCGEVGHNKADCTNEAVARPFTGTCRICSEEGHRAAECPQKPAEKCRGCGLEGHKAQDCQANRKIDRSDIPDMEKEAAWKFVKTAAADRDMAEVKRGLDMYVKADENVTYVELENRFRRENIGIYCIAQDMDIPRCFSLVNLQGRGGCKYIVGYYFQDKPKRKIFEDSWPASSEDNKERLADAGVVMENYVPICRNCDESGHTSKECPHDKVNAYEAPKITCSNCGEEGHRRRDCRAERQKYIGKNMDCRRCGEIGHMAKDCPNGGGGGGGEGRACHNCGSEDHMARDCNEPKKGRACHNCGSEDHMARDCDQPRKDRACRNCGEEGHVSRDCDKPKNPANVTCRNCDQMGHFSKECPEPRDWSRVKCQNCQQMGHGAKRCTEPPADDVGASYGGGDDRGFGGGTSHDTIATTGNWENDTAGASAGGFDAAETAGGGGW